ncbi:MAG: Ig-like domain-containing protein, partial [Mariprofundaceae bacterium]|nr:Ig-like domain-containing protein [Mariprofundaceae bacterium]
MDSGFVRTAVSDDGTLGFGNSITPGLLYDSSGTGIYVSTADWITPGTPLEFFSIKIGAMLIVNDNNLTTPGMPTTISGTGTQVTSISTTGGLSITQVYTINPGQKYIDIAVSVLNTTGASIAAVSYARGVDPDVDSNGLAGATAQTNNTRGSPAFSVTDYIRAVGPTSGRVLSLYSGDPLTHNTAVSPGWSKDPSLFLSGSVDTVGDHVMGLGFDLGTIAAGATVNFKLSYFIADSTAQADLLIAAANNLTLDTGANNSNQFTVTGGTGSFTYTTSNAAVVTVSPTGLITSVGAGTATITATDTVTGVTTTRIVTVYPPIINNLATANLDTGANNTNQFTVTGGSGTFTYATSVAAVATVNATGLITAVGAGTATITETDTATGFTTTRVVTVVAAIVNNAATANLDTGANNTNQFTATGGSGTFTYATSAAAVATVNATGLITSVGVGTATITVTDTTTGFTTTRVVTVVAAILNNAATTNLDTGVNNTNQFTATGGSGTFTYTTSAAAVATVSVRGLITSVGAGTATITATDTTTGFTTTRVVTVFAVMLNNAAT